MLEIFRKKNVTSSSDVRKDHHSIFTKVRAEQVNSLNVEDMKKIKAEKLFNEQSLFVSGKIDPSSKKIQPLNNVKLEQKDRRELREKDAGKAWGYMPKVELTEEIKNDLRAIQMRN